MKNFFILVLFSIVVLTSCNNEKPSENKTKIDADKTIVCTNEIKNLSNFLKKYDKSSQIFTVLIAKPTKVIGKQGTIIYINPTDLELDNGDTLSENIELELKELTNQEQLLRASAQTISNTQLLVSGGAYYINMTSNGKQVKLKDGKSLSVEFPRYAREEMLFFYGDRDTLGQIQWTQTKKVFEDSSKQEVSRSVKNSIVSDFPTVGADNLSDNKLTSAQIKEIEKYETVRDDVYKIIKINQFGWINCDRFYESPNTTDLQYVFKDSDSIVSAYAYLVFKDINSVMQSYYFSFDNPNLYFQNIPIGLKVQLIVFSIKNGEVYSFKKGLTIKKNEVVNVTLNKISGDEIQKALRLN